MIIDFKDIKDYPPTYPKLFCLGTKVLLKTTKSKQRLIMD